MATSLPLPCSSLINRILASGVAWARKSSTPDSRAMAAAVRGLSPVIITVRIPIARKRANRSEIPPFTTSLSRISPSTRGPSETASGVPPASPIFQAACTSSTGMTPPSDLTWVSHRLHGALAHVTVAEVAAAHARLGAELDETRHAFRLPAAQLVLLLEQHHDRPGLPAFHRPGWRAAPRPRAPRCGRPGPARSRWPCGCRA